ncbi:MAG: hypothetical protein IJ769_12240 [Clostridia bacterium]|nr:hypothetical protein [Clostridia bacterium]
MKIYDFDEKFYDYVCAWMAMRPGMTEKQVEEHYNEIMMNWLNAPAKWLNGEKPGEYFLRYSDPKELIKLLEEYDKRDIGLPEPLYSRVVSVGEPCVEPLMRVVKNDDNPESLRATALAILRDIDSDTMTPLLVDLVCAGKMGDEISEMAADVLSDGDGAQVDALLERYEGASAFAQLRILDICCNFPGDERVYAHLIDNLRNRPEERAVYASLLGKLGDARAVDVLKPFLSLTDIGYLDYIELRSAVEALGGDPGEDRTFYGDPDYEAMRNM